jgi:hypothetical protein
MKPIHSAASKYGLLQVIRWLCVLYTSSQLCNRIGTLEEIRSLTWLNAGFPDEVSD